MSDLESTDWSENASLNIQPAPGGWPSLSSPNIVYSTDREMMGALKRAWNRLGPTITSGGSANAQTLNYNFNPTALVRGQGYCFIAGFTNTGPMTLTVGALAAAYVFLDGVQLQGGEVRAGFVIEVFFDGTNYQITSGRTLASLASSFGSMRNFLLNPLFNVQQRAVQGAFNMALTASVSPYTLDRWYIVTNANQATGVSASTAVFGNPLGPYYATIGRNAGQTGTSTYVFAQTLDTDIIQLLAGQTVSIGCSMQGAANFSAANVTLQLLAGTGNPTRASAGFTGQTVVCSSIQAVAPGGSVVNFSATGVIPSTTRQLEFRIAWAPVGTAGAADQLIIFVPRLNLGSVDLGPDLTRIFTTEQPICKRFYQKSFPAGTAPINNAGTSGAFWLPSPVGASTAIAAFSVSFPVQMRNPPATTVVWNPSAANSQMRNASLNTDCTGTTIFIVNDASLVLAATTPASTVAGHGLAIHWTADAEIM